MKLFFILVLTLSTQTFTAHAKTQSNKKNSEPIVVYKKSETHKFSGLRLKGQLKKPDLSYIYKRKGLRAEQIVNIPENFNEEIIRGEGQF